MTAAKIETKNQIADLSGHALSRAIADLQSTRPGPGLWRFFSSTLLMFMSLAIAFQNGLESPAFYAAAALAGLFFAATAVTTHDAIHHTLTGIPWFDEISARVATWAVFWPHGTYSELHKLHHKMNGVDSRDPERVTFTESEYQSAGIIKKFFIRNQLLLAVLIGGGIGMILGHLWRALGFLKASKALRREVLADLVGILTVNGILYGFAAANGNLTKAIVLYIIVERIGGGLLQFRAHIEHYGLAGKRENYFSTQLHACRNIQTNSMMSWIFNGLNFHSIHHAFPKVPFYHLEEAHLRMCQLLKKEGAEAMPESKGYLRTFWTLASELKLTQLK